MTDFLPFALGTTPFGGDATFSVARQFIESMYIAICYTTGHNINRIVEALKCLQIVTCEPSSSREIWVIRTREFQVKVTKSGGKLVEVSECGGQS